jgi:RNA-binding protein
MLNEKQKRYLKSLVHDRKPVVIIGSKGLTQAVLDEIDSALDQHELIKIRANAEDRDARRTMVENLCAAVNAEMVQQIGHVATVFRQNPKKPRIQVP